MIHQVKRRQWPVSRGAHSGAQAAKRRSDRRHRADAPTCTQLPRNSALENRYNTGPHERTLARARDTNHCQEAACCEAVQQFVNFAVTAKKEPSVLLLKG